MVYDYQLIIYRFIVFIPILANKLMKIMIITTDTNPPVVELYSLSPLYLNSFEVGNRST